MKYGCHDRPPFRPILIVQDGWYLDGVTRTPKLASTPFRMAPECQYTLTELGQKDARCNDCKHKEEK